MFGADSGCRICYLQIGRDPRKIGESRKQAVESVYPLLIAVAIRLDQEFEHRNGRRNGVVTWFIEPGKNVVGERQVAGIFFKLINEDACV